MLNIPIVLPNEIDRSYLGAVMRQNGANKESEIIAKIALHVGLGDKTRRQAPTTELLGKIAQTDTQTFVRQHSTLPYRRGITSYFADLMHGSEDNRNILRDSGMRVARPGAYCCLECMKSDEKNHGRTFWHYEHQLPGQFWCPEHKLPLLYLESEHSFLLAPDQVIDKSYSVPESWMTNTIDNSYINSFLAISSALLETEKPFSVKYVSTILRDKAAARGFQTHGGKVKSPLLSDAVVAKFGREWLATVLPRLADKREGEINSQLDGVLYMATASSSVAAYILALSFLFDSPDEAMNSLTQTDIAEPAQAARKAFHIIENAELKSAYIKSHGSYSKTASLLMTSYAAISGRLRDMGLPNFKGNRANGLEKAAVAFFADGMSFADSAAVGKVSCNEFEKLFRVTGTTIVEMFEEMKKPLNGRGSGTRRPLKLTPHEVDSANGQLAIKYSPHIRREQRLTAECQA